MVRYRNGDRDLRQTERQLLNGEKVGPRYARMLLRAGRINETEAELLEMIDLTEMWRAMISGVEWESNIDDFEPEIVPESDEMTYPIYLKTGYAIGRGSDGLPHVFRVDWVGDDSGDWDASQADHPIGSPEDRLEVARNELVNAEIWLRYFEHVAATGEDPIDNFYVTLRATPRESATRGLPRQRNIVRRARAAVRLAEAALKK